MADKKISALTAATTPLAGTEVLPIVQSSTTVKVSVANLTAGRAISAAGITDTTLTASKTLFSDGSKALTSTGTVGADQGGTGQSSYDIGDLLYASGATALSKLAGVATGNALISGGVTTAPSWGKVGLTTHVSGTLPTANGGTNLTSFTANGVVYASSTSVLATGSGFTYDGTNLACSGYATFQDYARISYGGNTSSFQNMQAVTAGIGGTSGGVTSNWYAFDNAQLYPTADNTRNLGAGSFRYTNIYATNTTIQTSDKFEKQDIDTISDVEKLVAKRCLTLMRKFRWRSSVKEKGDEARIHFGLIAQDLAQAFEDYNLNPSRYAMFCSDTWYEVNGKPSPSLDAPYTVSTPGAVAVTRLGVRYNELFAFILAAM